MNKEKPKVNDIWISKYGTRVRIVFVDKYEVRYYFMWGNSLYKESETYSYFLENNKYLGKAKTNIEEIFYVKD